MKAETDTVILGIDATNLRGGGTQTHLIEVLKSADPRRFNFEEIVVWGSQSTLGKIEDRFWIKKRSSNLLNGNLIKRIYWQSFRLEKQVRSEGCNILWVPGGAYVGRFRPVVTMSQNMLPFDFKELCRYGLSLSALKLLIVRVIQSRSFKQADGFIFLTDYAKNTVTAKVGSSIGESVIIPHGIHARFHARPAVQKKIESYSFLSPYRILYVSRVEPYKHQWTVVEALGRLRRARGWPITLDLVGPGNSRFIAKLMRYIRKWDSHSEWVTFRAELPYGDIEKVYKNADLGLFASSCENLPNILIEMMAAGLPIASSDRGPMPEILGGAGVYFDPESVGSMMGAIALLIESPDLRMQVSSSAFLKSQYYSWNSCAEQTFKFLSGICARYPERSIA